MSDPGPEASREVQTDRQRLGAPRPRISAEARAPLTTGTQFSQPVRQIVLMIAVLALVIAGGWIAYSRILPIFLANRWLNGLILGVFVLGILACFWQVAQLVTSVSWIERFAARRAAASERGVAAVGAGEDRPPRLLAPLAAILGARGPLGGAISTGASRSILESVAARIEEVRDITRYLANLLIFLGLLGTFYGLASTVPAIVETIRALAPQPGETAMQVFDKLMSGLESQLGGMATAFSSSLLGLAGSLVVGLLELFATHGQNRFYRELEEWMSGFTRVGFASDGAEGADLSEPVARLAEMGALRDAAAAEADDRVMLMAQAVEALVLRLDADREAAQSREAALNAALDRVATGVERVAAGQDRARTGLDQMAAAQGEMVVGLRRLIEGQERVVAAAERPLPAPADLSALESALHRLVIDMNDGREEMLAELRSDLLVLTRAVRAARFNDPFRDDLLGGPGHRTGG